MSSSEMLREVLAKVLINDPVHEMFMVANTVERKVGLAVVNGQLYAVGGFDGTTYLKTVEVYDRECNQWRQSGCMTYRRLGGGVGVVRLANDQAAACSAFVPDIPPFGDPPSIRD
ncbi:unnamed protein product [Toxocara canis]|uniref:Kelch repeat protein n=1 Tax=Toxocara canis TaxID=6265 RepID=A0A183UQN7_TOXCA|nr:unnamed protein product [Toxocara canis]